MNIDEITQSLENIAGSDMKIGSKILVKVEDLVSIHNYIDILEQQLEEIDRECQGLRAANKTIYDTFKGTVTKSYNELGEYIDV